MVISLHQHLLDLNGDVLKGWLRQADASDKTATRKEQFALLIERQLTKQLPAVLARLSEAETRLLAESAHQRRLVTQREFVAKYGGACPMPRGYYEHGAEVSLLEAFIHFPDHRYGEEPHLIGSLVEPLRGLLPKPDELKVETVTVLPKTWPPGQENESDGGKRMRPIHVFESEGIAPVELSRVLRLIQGGKVKVTDATHRPTEATVRLVGEALVVPDFDLEMPEAHRDQGEREFYQPAGSVRAHGWPVLVQQCGWAKARGGALALTRTGKDIVLQFTPENFCDGVSHGLANGDFDELNRINHIRGQTGKAKRWMTNPGLRKLSIVQALERLPVGEWLSFKEACRLVEASPEAWDVLREREGVLYFSELQYGSIYETADINRQFLRAFFMESLATLGVLDLGYIYPHRLWPDLSDQWGTDDLPFCGRYDGLLYVRLNPLGAFVLGTADEYELRTETGPRLFRVLPNLDCVLTQGSLNPADRSMLELFAAPKSDVVWTIEADRMLTHFETGGTFQELRGFLEANAVDGVPANVRTFLDELERKLDACRSRRDAVLLEWRDPALAHLIATSAGTKTLCFHAGDDRLVVPRANLAAFARAVKKLGYVLPRGAS